MLVVIGKMLVVIGKMLVVTDLCGNSLSKSVVDLFRNLFRNKEAAIGLADQDLLAFQTLERFTDGRSRNSVSIGNLLGADVLT